MKIAEYFGYEIAVPDNATHLAADSDGTVYAFCGKPVMRNTVWWSRSLLTNGTATCFATDCPRLDTRSVNWRETLKEIE